MKTDHTEAKPFMEAMSKSADADKVVKLFQELWNDSANNMYNISKWQETFVLLLNVAKPTRL